MGGRGRPGSWKDRVVFVYEDDDIIVVEKPEGLAVIAPEGSRSLSLYDIVTLRIRRDNPKGRAAVVHRLDRDSSGVMVFAKHAAAKKALMDTWNELVFERRYQALVEGSFARSEGVFDTWLAENRAGQVYTVPDGSPGAQEAVTRWKLVQAGARYSLVE
ncbi:MAG TPA: RNA pseudouridine synthase, partial [Rectinemataceae bacterium]